MQLRTAVEKALADAQEARLKADAEVSQFQHAAERTAREIEDLRAEAARVPAQALDADRPIMVASKIDEVQLRRLQEAPSGPEVPRRLARLRAAWRGE